MENNSPDLKAHFIARLRTVMEQAPRQIFCGWDRPPPIERGGLPPYPRLILFFGSSDTIKISNCGNHETVVFTPADMLYCVTGGWTTRLNRNDVLTLSLVFNADFLRLIENRYIENEEVGRHWYHTAERVSEGTFFLLRVLDALGHEKHLDQMRPLLRLLIERVIDELEHDNPGGGSRSWYTYQRVMNYLAENYHIPINRESVAGDLKINRSHITRLFSQYAGDSFNRILTRMRMESAVQLLVSQPLLSVREIADRCGYAGPDYFIKAFRRYHGVTPEQFRRRHGRYD